MATLPMEQRIVHVLKRHKKLTATGIFKRASFGKRERERMYRELERMKREGLLLYVEGQYMLAPGGAGKTLSVRVGSVHEKFGFVTDEKSGEELFVPGRYLRGVLPGDRALLREKPARGQSREGEILEIREEADFTFSGVFRRREHMSLVLPDTGLRGEVVVAPGQTLNARDGDKVVARISRRADNHRDIRAQVLAVAGSAQDARACAAAVLRAQNIRPDFEAHVEKEAERLARAGVEPEELSGRVNLREELIFTIDGASSKDLDDAVSLRTLSTGWEVGVHIADVSHYVRPRSPLDLEAFDRGTSIYYADQVVPMLPKSLSNGICSLSQGEDRLTLSAFITLDTAGDIVDSRFVKSVIRSRLKGVYSECNAILDGSAGEALLQKYGGLTDALREMSALAGRLHKKRQSRGAIDLNSVESAFLFDETGAVTDVTPRTQGAAESLVEEFMLLANQAAAAFGYEQKLPFLYRIHEAPPTQKTDGLFELLGRLGLQVKKPEGDVPPSVLRDILESVRGSELEIIVNNQILRSMAKARYSETAAGHYGLTLRRYSHFTSPIRRYPDLAIHRIISESLSGASQESLAARYGVFAAKAAAQSSERELRAMNVERVCDSCFAAQAMLRHIGAVFQGVIGSVAPHGFYVLLENSVEGLVRVDTLDGEYDFDGAVTLTSRFGGGRYRVGDRVRVMVIRADVSSGQIDFAVQQDAAGD